MFSVVGMGFSVAAYFAVLFLRPEQICDQEYYAKATKLMDTAAKVISMAGQTRPNNISVCKVVQTFIENLPEKLLVSDIVIRPEQYVIKGTCSDIDKVYDYVENLNFGPMAEKNLSTLQHGTGSFGWTIDVTFKKKGKK